MAPSLTILSDETWHMPVIWGGVEGLGKASPSILNVPGPLEPQKICDVDVVAALYYFSDLLRFPTGP